MNWLGSTWVADVWPRRDAALELLGLKWADVDLTAGRLMVRRTVWRDLECLPKGGRAREVPLSNEAVAVLKEHRHLNGPWSSARMGAGSRTAW